MSPPIPRDEISWLTSGSVPPNQWRRPQTSTPAIDDIAGYRVRQAPQSSLTSLAQPLLSLKKRKEFLGFKKEKQPIAQQLA